MAYAAITDHGLIGDLHTAALVDGHGRLVWLPWPRFDSPSLFAAILDSENGGEWLLAPTEINSCRQAYEDETAVLVTTFETPHGRAELRDWMSPWDGDAPGHEICRVLHCTDGEVEVRSRFAPRPDYARIRPTLIEQPYGLRFEAHDLTLYLATDWEHWQIEDGVASFTTTLRAGDEVRCVLSSGGENVPVSAIDSDLRKTREFWQRWMRNCTYTGPWAGQVRRSAITLKLLVYAPSGAIIAAPTTSLPEWIGGSRNWDYRYTWLRDASFTLYAFYLLGYKTEASRFFHWLGERAKKHRAPLQIMYGVDGETRLDEFELPHLEGYRCSPPVRIGNAAYHQRQLDVYGGIIDAAYLYERKDSLLTPEEWNGLKAGIEYVCDHWDEPDQGIWEMRGPPQHHTFSKLMCWVTLDRGIRLAENEGWDYDQERWTQIREAIRGSILENGWDADVGAFTMAYGDPALDASLLLLPLMGFLPPSDRRVHATVEQIKQQLSRGPLVYRYRIDDSLAGDEGAFLLCSFWMVDALTMIGRVDEAVERFDALLKYASVHGLLPEEVDPATGTALGNYPQAFSHIGLINSAINLTRARQDTRTKPSPGTK